MTRHYYTTREFFRQMPNALLDRYFEGQGVLGYLDFAAMKDTQPDELFDAWMELPDDKRNTMDATLQEIFSMSCEKGFRAIVDEAAWHLRTEPQAQTEFVEKLAALANHYERAMVTYLEHEKFWKGATLFYHADNLSYWRKRKNLPHQPVALDPESRLEFAQLISSYFHRTEGRGKNCIVELFRRGELDYFFAYPEDYSQQSLEWVNGEFDRRPHNPAFEVVYIYSQKEGKLDLNYRGSNKSIEPLQVMFAEAMLKLPELPTDPDDERIYDLNPLMKRDFRFVFDVASGIESVAVKRLRLSYRVKKGDRITVEADAGNNAYAVYDVLDQIAKSMSLNLFYVSQVELAVKVLVDVNKPLKSVTVRITYPNSCSLKYDEFDMKLRGMLEDSGIEPKEPLQGALPTETVESAQG